MSVTLTPQTEEQIRHWIDTGVYPDADAVVRNALHLLGQQHDRFETLRAKIQMTWVPLFAHIR
jgi:putative addiction module CopG family antidote